MENGINSLELFGVDENSFRAIATKILAIKNSEIDTMRFIHSCRIEGLTKRPEIAFLWGYIAGRIIEFQAELGHELVFYEEIR
jgi:hypothetical protein